MVVLFGYRHVNGIPLCPCGDPGNYMMLEQTGSDPLQVQFRCWCGATMKCTFDTLMERDEFMKSHSD